MNYIVLVTSDNMYKVSLKVGEGRGNVAEPCRRVQLRGSHTAARATDSFLMHLGDQECPLPQRSVLMLVLVLGGLLISLKCASYL